MEESDSDLPKNAWFKRHGLIKITEPAPGSHLVTTRFGFSHHGIYVGDWMVVHYGGFERRLHRAPVEEVSFARFARGRAVFVRPHTTAHFRYHEAVSRARSRIGEDDYRVLRNNCEHFCEWCLQDEQRSYQVDHLLNLPLRLARVWQRLTASLLLQGPVCRLATVSFVVVGSETSPRALHGTDQAEV